MLKPTITLTPEQITFFQREGYLTLPAITTAEEVERLREIYDHLFAIRAGREEGNQFDLAGADEEDKPATLPQILNPAKYAPELATALYRANAQAIARQLLGPETNYMGEHAIFKPPKVGAETPWHQDEAYWDPGLDYEALSVWMPLQEATLQNGCMQFIPGSHQLEVQPHHTIGHDPRVHGLEIDSIDISKAVACPILAGGATIHHCRTVHYAGPNLSDIPRRAYILLFRLPTKKREVIRNFYWTATKQTAREERRKKAQAANKL
jgi:ectoine hydroxylase-related dioxygenase (phytanoyl-CoA dioxygenase family)